MTEIEFQFKSGQAVRDRLEPDLTASKTKTFTDVYFDDSDFSFISRDTWLRKRGDAWQLKVQAGDASDTIRQYDEITDESEIAKRLGIELNGLPLTDVLNVRNITPAIALQTQRETHTHTNGSTVVFDTVTSPTHTDFLYELGEVEMEVDDQKAEARDVIEKFITTYNLQKAEGKVRWFIELHIPELHSKLIREGVIHPEKKEDHITEGAFSRK